LGFEAKGETSMVAKITAAAMVMIVAGVLLAATSADVPQCLHDARESIDQRVRRQAAVRYLRQVNTAQTRLRQERKTFVPLAEAAGSDSTPFGFVPRLTFDRWSYTVILKDVLDPCGFSLFSDQDNVIYEAHPVALVRDIASEKCG